MSARTVAVSGAASGIGAATAAYAASKLAVARRVRVAFLLGAGTGFVCGPVLYADGGTDWPAAWLPAG
jgi:hypothetical protein